MSYGDILSPRPVRSWMPIPSTSPPPYEEYEDFETKSPEPSTSSYPPTPPPGSQQTYERTYHAQMPPHSSVPPLAQPRAQRGNSDDIDHLREAISTLESRMASLLSERDSLEMRLESAVRLQSPVHRLPSELLASIFTTCIMSMEEEDTLMLSTIMLVSRHWKEVALNTSILWSRIVAGTHHSLAKTFRKLERSKSIPLHICVDFSPRVENGTVTTESIVRTMDLLRTSVWRWKTFRLTVPNRPQAHAALTRCKESAPLLEVLSIHVLHSMQEDVFHPNPPRALFEGQTPSLTYCSMTSFNFGWDIHLLSHLRVLKLGGYWNGYAPSMDTTLSVLRACPRLEELVLRNMSDIDSGSCPGFDTDPSEYDDVSARVSDTRTIHLPHLVNASFYYSGTVRTRTILSLLTCPALESVDLCFLDNVSPMIEHLRRQSLTFLPLRRLRIESCFFSELKLARFLRRVPSLTTLELVDVEDASSSLLRNLATPPTAQTWVCPKLATLSLEGCTTLDWEAIRSVVESRLPPNSRAYSRPISSTSSSPRGFSSASSSASNAAQRPPLATSSASAFAATAHILAHTPATFVQRAGTSGLPQRLQSMDLTRCHQISKEMVQWLRLYVNEVKCDNARGVWGDSTI